MQLIQVAKRLADLVAGQWGLVTTPQATALGVTHSHLNRLAEQDVITRLSHGVYQLRSAPSDRHVDLRAAWLALAPTLTAGQRLQNPNDGPIVSHASAASLHGWGDLTAYDSEFTFDGRKQTRRNAVRIHRGSTPMADVEIVDGLPATTAERLIADLLAAGYDTDHIGAVLAGAIRDRSIDLERLAERVAPYAMRRGFDHLAGDELVSALVRSGDAQDEAVADSLVRLAKVSDYRRSPEFTRQIAQLAGDDLPKMKDVAAALGEQNLRSLQSSGVLNPLRESIAKMPMPDLDSAIMASIPESTAKIAVPELDPAIMASIWERIAPDAMRIVAESGAAERIRKIATQALAGIETNNLGRDHPEAHRILKDPATMQALANARKLV